MKSWMFLAVLLCASIFAGCGGDKGTESNGNQPPSVPSNPSPANNTSDQNVDITLSWQCSDPDGDSLVFDLYFGTDSTSNLVSHNQSQMSYNPGQLTASTTYFWKIVSKDNNGHSTFGAVWSFTTIGNTAPNEPSSPIPASGFSGYGTKLTPLDWECTDPNQDPLTYDLYFGTNSNPPLVKSNLQQSSYTPTSYDPFYYLEHNTTYYWRIIAKDDHQHETASQIWQFSTVKEIELVGELGSLGGTFYDVVVFGSIAYVADRAGELWTIDISNPASPRTVGRRGIPGPVDLEVSGNLLLVAAKGYLYIFDISNPSSIVKLSRTAVSGPWNSTGLSVADNYVYMGSMDSASSRDCVDILDISLPSVPVKLATLWGPVYNHVLAWSNYLDAGVHLYDVSDPASPVLLSDSWGVIGDSISVAGDFINGQTLYGWDGYGNFCIVDITEPMNPMLLGSYTIPDHFNRRGVFVDANCAYMTSSNYAWKGLLVIDITDPSVPKRIGTYRNSGGASGVFASGGYIYLAAWGGQGLQILQIVQ